MWTSVKIQCVNTKTFRKDIVSDPIVGRLLKWTKPSVGNTWSQQRQIPPTSIYVQKEPPITEVTLRNHLVLPPIGTTMITPAATDLVRSNTAATGRDRASGRPLLPASGPALKTSQIWPVSSAGCWLDHTRWHPHLSSGNRKSSTPFCSKVAGEGRTIGANPSNSNVVMWCGRAMPTFRYSNVLCELRINSSQQILKQCTLWEDNQPCL